MFGDLAGFLLALALVVVGGIIWGIRQEGRITNLKELMNLQKEVFEKEVESLSDKVKEVEKKHEDITGKLFEKVSIVEKMLHEIIGELRKN